MYVKLHKYNIINKRRKKDVAEEKKMHACAETKEGNVAGDTPGRTCNGGKARTVSVRSLARSRSPSRRRRATAFCSTSTCMRAWRT